MNECVMKRWHKKDEKRWKDDMNERWHEKMTYGKMLCLILDEKGHDHTDKKT